MSFAETLAAKGQEAGLSFSNKQLEQFATYCTLLLETNKVMNLTAIEDPDEVAVKHMIDSLLVYKKTVFAGQYLADVGTGAGFPGLPLKIYEPSLKVVLVDSLAKRLDFLQKVIDTLGLKDIECVHARAEDVGQNPRFREKFPLVIARAVANLPVLAEYCLPLVTVGGTFFALKGAKYQEEVAASGNALKLLGGRLLESREVKLPGLTDKRAIITIRKEKATPAKYPRKAGMVNKKPL